MFFTNERANVTSKVTEYLSEKVHRQGKLRYLKLEIREVSLSYHKASLIPIRFRTFNSDVRYVRFSALQPRRESDVLMVKLQ